MYNYKISYCGNKLYQYEIFNEKKELIGREAKWNNAQEAEIWAKVRIRHKLQNKIKNE